MIMCIVSGVVIPILSAQLVNTKDKLRISEANREYWQKAAMRDSDKVLEYGLEIVSLKEQMKKANLEVIEVANGEKIVDAIKKRTRKKKIEEPKKLADNEVDYHVDDRFGKIE